MISASRMVCFMKELPLEPAGPAIREASAPSEDDGGLSRALQRSQRQATAQAGQRAETTNGASSVGPQRARVPDRLLAARQRRLGC